jgi:hypothetical protein
MVLDEFDCTKFCWILLGMPGFGELVLDKVFPIDTGRPLA